MSRLQQGSIVILLLGGNKSGQDRDIKKAAKIWLEYLKSLKE